MTRQATFQARLQSGTYNIEGCIAKINNNQLLILKGKHKLHGCFPRSDKLRMELSLSSHNGSDETVTIPL